MNESPINGQRGGWSGGTVPERQGEAMFACWAVVAGVMFTALVCALILRSL